MHRWTWSEYLKAGRFKNSAVQSAANKFWFPWGSQEHYYLEVAENAIRRTKLNGGVSNEEASASNSVRCPGL
jgi:hypothetical protein